jgi:hypothetical protein
MPGGKKRSTCDCLAVDAAEPLDRIEEPRLAANHEVEEAIAADDDMERGGLLCIDEPLWPP